jgi:hypothetical protein
VGIARGSGINSRVYRKEALAVLRHLKKLDGEGVPEAARDLEKVIETIPQPRVFRPKKTEEKEKPTRTKAQEKRELEKASKSRRALETLVEAVDAKIRGLAKGRVKRRYFATGVFKCLDDYEACVRREYDYRVCIAMTVICIAQKLIPFASRDSDTQNVDVLE